MIVIFFSFMNFIKYGATIEDIGDSKRKKIQTLWRCLKYGLDQGPLNATAQIRVSIGGMFTKL
jgi:hypothetical protein